MSAGAMVGRAPAVAYAAPEPPVACTASRFEACT
jgi:hypothetical protein